VFAPRTPSTCRMAMATKTHGIPEEALLILTVSRKSHRSVTRNHGDRTAPRVRRPRALSTPLIVSPCENWSDYFPAFPGGKGMVTHNFARVRTCDVDLPRETEGTRMPPRRELNTRSRGPCRILHRRCRRQRSASRHLCVIDEGVVNATDTCQCQSGVLVADARSFNLRRSTLASRRKAGHAI
jgi:hypothetical protein